MLKSGQLARRHLASALVFCASVAAYFDFSNIYSNLDADSIIVYLVSLINWMPFFWAQDRYGMLIPWLASPLHNAFHNLLLQNFLHAFCSVSVFFLAANYIFSGGRWLLAGQAGVLVCVLFFSPGDLTSYFLPWQIYTPGLAFGLLGLLLARRNFWLGAACELIAQWLNFSTGVLLTLLVAPLSILDFRQRKGEIRRQVPALTVGLIGGEVLRRFYATTESQSYGVAGVDRWWLGWWEIFKHFYSSPQTSLWVLLVPAALALASLFWAESKTIRRTIAALLAATMYVAIAGASHLAAMYDYPPRYLIPFIIVFVAACMGLVANSFNAKFERKIVACLFLTTFGVLFCRLGPPSPQVARESLEQRLAPIGRDAVQLHCTHVMGDFNRVWPAVFYARLANAPPIWGISMRSFNTFELWDPLRYSNPRICIWKNDLDQAKFFIKRYALGSLATVDQSSEMYVLKLVK